MLCALVGVWIGALLWLPDAPSASGPLQAGVEASATGQRAHRTLAQRLGLVRVVPAPVLTTPLAVPVAGIPREGISDSWGDPRENGLRAHHGTDIMAAPNTPVLAAADGTVEKLWTSAAGGTTIYVRSPARDWTYYYAHLSGYAAGLHEGQAVHTGEQIGYVGDTGNAGPGNYHLHFGLTHTLPTQRWYQGQDVNPYPYLAGHSLAGASSAR